MANSRPSASNFKIFSRSLEQFFLTVGQNNFGIKIPFFKHCNQVFLHFQELSLANTTLNDYGAANLAAALESNSALSKLNIESNSVSPQCLVKIFEAANVQQTMTQIKASNQMAQFLGNKVEMAITKAVEGNKTLQRVGLHFEFGDCRYVINA